jgi:hypothetical protein
MKHGLLEIPSSRSMILLETSMASLSQPRLTPEGITIH